MIFWGVNSSAPSLEYMRQKENPGISSPCLSCPQVPNWSDCSPLFIFSLCLFSIYYLGFLIVLSGKNRGKYVCSISPEVEGCTLACSQILKLLFVEPKFLPMIPNLSWSRVTASELEFLCSWVHVCKQGGTKSKHDCSTFRHV